MTHKPSSRAASLTALTGETFDVLVVGGGITGAGVARDAAMRGLRVALVEREDFASGTSSRSSRLVHGGVRYLEHGQLRLVFESSRERRTLLRIAPHLVRPLPFVWPVYRGARISRIKLALALTLYDLLALFRNVQRHSRLSTADVLRYEPGLDPIGLLGGARYWDAATDDARLTLATVLSARESGAVIVNHAIVVALLREDAGRVGGARITDALSGASHDVRARLVVNATGPWSDQIEAMAAQGATAGVRGSKGVHICVPRERIRNTAAITLTAPQDGRVMFVLPAGAFTIVGTTDTFDGVAPEEVRASDADIEYLLAAANHYFRDARLARADVVSSWAGIRPLAALAGSTGGPGSASREHAITHTAPGLLRVTGGKLTTYRAMARAVVDVVLSTLGASATRCTTADQPLAGGAVDVARATATATAAVGDASVAERLVHAHGARWRDVWGLAEVDAALRERVIDGRPYLLAELRHAIEHEMAHTLGDLLIRRVPVAFETADHGFAVAARVAPLVAAWAGWDAEATRQALATYDADARRIFGGEG